MPRFCNASASRPFALGRAARLSLLVMCWSYILSARLLELQGRNVVCTRHSLPVEAKIMRAKPGVVVLNLGASASPKLIRWLCAIRISNLQPCRRSEATRGRRAGGDWNEGATS
ncbi:hypothetical protein B0T24DRAFT_603598 [Lasiosphaeria ovina]|uniref:Uncharacterized protein n=1 Tax=Lasiosphaeria ovina TaxID=92902 RepID=A0AAE0NKB6_9PEZI|nr:hypothetical protein B0T24DRAFT_603598 [Lasiosphaeria ovina]